ncbi:MAG: siderophore-interacting protein [Nocardioidaceae bacterium]
MARELTYFRGEVRDRRELSAHLVRLVIGGDGIGGWVSSGVPDEALLVVVPEPGSTHLTMPDEVGDGDDPYERSRWYTVRRYDDRRHELTVDVVLHESGLATGWARDVRAGDAVGISSTHHWYARPANARWQVLCGDIVALPAIGRIIEQTPDHVRTLAYVEVPDLGDRQPGLGAAVTWVHNPRLGDRGSELAGIVRGLRLPDGTGYVYVAGEASATRAVRKYLRHEAGLEKGSYGVVGYWRVRSEEWMRRYREARIDLESVYADGERNGTDPEQLSDEVDRRLDAAGL